MLSLQMKSGEYLTIGENVVVQVFKGSGSQFRVSVKAPREVSILRGEVRERTGTQRPDGLLDKPPKKTPAEQAHAARQLEKYADRLETRRRAAETRADAAQQMQAIFDRLDTSPEVQQALRTQLKRLEQSE